MRADTTTANTRKRRHRARSISVDDSRTAWKREVVLGILLGIVAIGVSGLVAATFNWLDGWTGVLAGWTVGAGLIWIIRIVVKGEHRRNRRTAAQSSASLAVPSEVASKVATPTAKTGPSRQHYWSFNRRCVTLGIWAGVLALTASGLSRAVSGWMDAWPGGWIGDTAPLLIALGLWAVAIRSWRRRHSGIDDHDYGPAV